LEEFPIVNSSLNDKADALLQHSSHNIGVAMATPSGLVVPNIKDVQHRNVASIAAELVRLQKDAAIGRVNQSDVTGGTVSISNIGDIVCGVCVYADDFDKSESLTLSACAVTFEAQGHPVHFALNCVVIVCVQGKHDMAGGLGRPMVLAATGLVYAGV